MVTGVGVLLCALLLVASPLASTEFKRPKSFTYTFRVTAVTLDATFTAGKAKAHTTLHVDTPSRPRTLTWVNGLSPNNTNGIGPTVVTLEGRAAYSSADPTCAQTRPFHSKRPTPVVIFALSDPARLNVEKFPVAVPHPGADGGPTWAQYGKCGEPVFDWFDEANIKVPVSAFSRPTLTVTATRHSPNLGDGEGIDWTLRVTLKRLAYKLLKGK